jgi:hypothetical protein
MREMLVLLFTNLVLKPLQETCCGSGLFIKSPRFRSVALSRHLVNALGSNVQQAEQFIMVLWDSSSQLIARRARIKQQVSRLRA